MNWKRAAGVVCVCLGLAAFAVVTRKDLRAAEAVEENSKPFFPVAVWYSGGKDRAPMLEQVNAESARLWKEDLQKIKGLGFIIVRSWVEWNVGEPREAEYHPEHLDLLLRPADEVGLRVIVLVNVRFAPEPVGV